MKKTVTAILGILIISVFVIGLAGFAAAAGSQQQGPIQVNGDKYQNETQAMTQYTYQFRQRTQIRFNSSVGVNLNIDCDAMNIGEKTFSLEIKAANGNMTLNMTCRQNETQLGIQAGQAIRNQNRARLMNQFTVRLQANSTCNATLGLSMTEQEAVRAEWAYYNESTDEWVPVDSEYVDGMLVADTTHFSVWTVVTADDAQSIDFGFTAFIIFGLIGASLVGIYAIKKSKLVSA